MDTFWWWALGAVVLLAFLVTLVDGLGRGGRPPARRRRPAGRTRPPGRPAGTGTARGTGARPRPGEIWWALVPYEDGPGGKDRPCLVLAVRGGRACVVKITSKHHDGRPGVIALPPGAVGDARERPSFLETDELRDVPLGDFRRRAGTAGPEVWERVRHLSR
ncbi:type II toxin-antitoxin system PemK/MazF family toxin [Streptomyces sp. LP05-1]|uniref:Type II toxin-antitoxin system PemK/MazF family toxin n=1 Tax=Streptomyces pyxinae TaxID=2970734 RepID=A0ABT2CC24_9ACTN|nr:type II toxin-antitoxin system PemK/MazF family toxin [Streptomyces sp. LP05-1]MCS0634667.1 type II toxin-antitoxin system PemK/MazF family toxin [Streptomyces sp. LP05-1]